jgi:hypothetical protein
MEQTQAVRDYYARVLTTKDDLQTSACCTAETLPKHAREIAKLLHAEVVEKFYGFGLFPCGPVAAPTSNSEASSGGACC